MSENDTPTGSTKFFYVWDEVYGWIHISERDKLEEARERFLHYQSSIRRVRK